MKKSNRENCIEILQIQYTNGNNAKRSKSIHDATYIAKIGEQNIIKKIGGSTEIKQHLETLGFVVGGYVTVINTIAGNVIVNVKESAWRSAEKWHKKL